MLGRTTILALALVAGLASCAPATSEAVTGSASHPPTAATASAATASAATATGAALPPVLLTDRDNGRTIRAASGQLVVVRLRRTTWTFDPVTDVAVIRPLGPPVTRRGRCAPGVGCGSVTLTVRAAAPGTAQITASRRICGEVLLCRPDQRRFRVAIAVR